MVFYTNYRLMKVKSIAEYSKGSILQYFRPSLSYHLSLRSLSIFELPFYTGFTVPKDGFSGGVVQYVSNNDSAFRKLILLAFNLPFDLTKTCNIF